MTHANIRCHQIKNVRIWKILQTAKNLESGTQFSKKNLYEIILNNDKVILCRQPMSTIIIFGLR